MEDDKFHKGNQLNNNYNVESMRVNGNDDGNQPKCGTMGGGVELTGTHNASGDQSKYGTVGRDGGLTWAHNVRGDEVRGDQSKDDLNDIQGGWDDRHGLNSTGGSSWFGTQEDKDDFVTLSDEFLRNSGAMEDDMRDKMEDDFEKFEAGGTIGDLNVKDDDEKVTSLAEKLIDPGDQLHTNTN